MAAFLIIGLTVLVTYLIVQGGERLAVWRERREQEKAERRRARIDRELDRRSEAIRAIVIELAEELERDRLAAAEELARRSGSDRPSASA